MPQAVIISPSYLSGKPPAVLAPFSFPLCHALPAERQRIGHIAAPGKNSRRTGAAGIRSAAPVVPQARGRRDMIRLGYHYSLDLIYTDMVSVRRLHAYGVRQTGGHMCGRSATGKAKKAVNGDRVQKMGHRLPCPVDIDRRQRPFGRRGDRRKGTLPPCPVRHVFLPAVMPPERLDKAIGVQQFLKRNIFPFCLSHHSQYDSITAFFDFQNEKIFSFQVEDFRQAACCIGAASRPKNTGVC